MIAGVRSWLEVLSRMMARVWLTVLYLTAIAPFGLITVTHVDGTARPQFVEQAINPLYYELICRFGQASGHPVLLNTSFNLRGEPIVGSAADAISTFQRSGLDVVYLGDYRVAKQGAS